MLTAGEVSDVSKITGSGLPRSWRLQIQEAQIKMMQTEDLIVRLDGPAKRGIEIKSDWLFHFRDEITWLE